VAAVGIKGRLPGYYILYFLGWFCWLMKLLLVT